MSVCVYNGIKCGPYVPEYVLTVAAQHAVTQHAFFFKALRFYKPTLWGMTRKYKEREMSFLRKKFTRFAASDLFCQSGGPFPSLTEQFLATIIC